MSAPTLAEQETSTAGWRDPRDFVSPEVYEKEIQLLMRDQPFDRVMAERVFSQAVAYLITSMENRMQAEGHLGLTPGPIVDIGVHVFLLDTVNYREFCHAHFNGGFLEHVPEVEFKFDGSVQRTAQVIAKHGFPVDWSLWEADYAKCGPCSPGNPNH